MKALFLCCWTSVKLFHIIFSYQFWAFFQEVITKLITEPPKYNWPQIAVLLPFWCWKKLSLNHSSIMLSLWNVSNGWKTMRWTDDKNHTPLAQVLFDRKKGQAGGEVELGHWRVGTSSGWTFASPEREMQLRKPEDLAAFQRKADWWCKIDLMWRD